MEGSACRPPWDDIGPWVEKAFASKALTVFLLPARTDTPRFHLLKDSGAEIRLFRKRVHFLRDGIGGNQSPTDGTMVAVVRRMNAQDADLPVSKPFVWTEMLRFGATEQLVSSRTSLDGMLPLTRAESDVIALVNFAATQ